MVKAAHGSDVSGYYLDSIRQPIWAVHASGSNLDMQEQLQSIVESTLEQLCTEGIDKELLEASLNSIEFALRESDFGGRPIGLAYVIRMMDNWLYGHDPLELLHYEEALVNIRKGLQGTYFEDLIRHSVLGNNHKSDCVLISRTRITRAKDAEVKAELANIKASMTQDELQAIVDQTKRLKLRQETPDSEEALATIPLLELSDLSPDVEDVDVVKA